MKRLLAILYATSMWAATTTVSQMVVGPNNQPASGQALIRLSAACTSNGSYVGQQTITVKFTATPPTGQTNNFSAALVPNDTCVVSGALVSTSYSVSWTLTGGPSWTETWIVPTSGTAVSVDSVKVAQANLPTIAGVIIMTGGGYTTTPTDGQYIRWNASMNAWQPVTFVDQETVSGTLDGTNVTFTLANAPGPSAGLVLFRNGIVQKAGQDYTLSGNTITFVTAATPQSDDTLLAWYRY